MTGIQWTDETWNPTIGCRRVSEGCRNCYAETQAARIVAMQRGNGQRSAYEDVIRFGPYGPDSRGVDLTSSMEPGEPLPRWNGRAVFLPERLDQPLRWRKPRRVFVNSMSDLFHEDLDFEQIAAVFGVMAATPRHTYQVLTKRPERALEFFRWLGWRDGTRYDECISFACGEFHVDEQKLKRMKSAALAPAVWPLPNVWLGVSAEDQATADERIPLLLQCPAAVRFVSAEPLLSEIDFYNASADWDMLTGENYGQDSDGAPEPRPNWPGLDWVIVGGESGTNGRDCDIDWIRAIVDQCRDAGVPCFVKQLGAQPISTHPQYGYSYELALKDRKGGDPDEWPEDLRVRQFPQTQQEPEQ